MATLARLRSWSRRAWPMRGYAAPAYGRQACGLGAAHGDLVISGRVHHHGRRVADRGSWAGRQTAARVLGGDLRRSCSAFKSVSFPSVILLRFEGPTAAAHAGTVLAPSVP